MSADKPKILEPTVLVRGLDEDADARSVRPAAELDPDDSLEMLGRDEVAPWQDGRAAALLDSVLQWHE